MIKVKVKRENNNITYINVTGHAEFADYGSDIVCSAVSCLCFTIANQLLSIDETLNITAENNDFSFTNLSDTHDVQLLLNTLVNGLVQVEDEYSKNIKVMEV